MALGPKSGILIRRHYSQPLALARVHVSSTDFVNPAD